MPGKKFESENKFKREDGEITHYFQRHDVIDAKDATFQGEWRVTEHLRDAGLAVQTKERTIDFSGWQCVKAQCVQCFVCGNHEATRIENVFVKNHLEWFMRLALCIAPCCLLNHFRNNYHDVAHYGT